MSFVFTAATNVYVDPIINAIEQKGIKFERRLYRVHTIDVNNDLVKDISKLGRDLSRSIIVGNMEKIINYNRKWNNNKTFLGKDINDMALYDLISILIYIAKNNMEVREGLRAFKEDIISRIT